MIFSTGRSPDGAKTRKGGAGRTWSKTSSIELWGLVFRGSIAPAQDVTFLCFFEIFGSGDERGLLNPGEVASLLRGDELKTIDGR